jgi:hypothetical protein
MSKHPTGSKDWWIETGLIAAGGFAMAAWLWDGPLAERAEMMDATQLAGEQAIERWPSQTLGELLEAGCLTSEHLRALREGREVRVSCPPTRTNPNNPSDAPRPFP